MASAQDSAGRWYLVDSGPCGAAFNMALDEALLEATPRLGRPVLRFYAWTEPAATFGYFQKYDQIALLTTLRPLVRRPTGGGLVPHDADWTYSLAFPPGSEWYELAAKESYHRVHSWLEGALARLGIVTHLAPQKLVAGPGQCFVGHEASDLLWRGRKIAGAAQRRRRDGLLIQGSLQPGVLPLSRPDWQEAVAKVAEERFGVDWETMQVEGGLVRRAEELSGQKYGQSAYNERR